MNNAYISSLASTAIVISSAGCFVFDEGHLDELRQDGGSDSSVAEVDAGSEPDSGPPNPLIATCGDMEADYAVPREGRSIRVSTIGLGNRVSACGSADAAGEDGFFAIDVVAGQYWHFHVRVDEFEAGQERDPFLYLLPASGGACDSRICQTRSDQCRGAGDEHFAFVAPTSGRWYLGIDDYNPGGGVYQVEAFLPQCDGLASTHGEACDGTEGCNSQCRMVLSSQSPHEQLPNDNMVEANVLDLGEENSLVIGGDIGGGSCTYPDVFMVTVPADHSELSVEIVGPAPSNTVCTDPEDTPFDIVLRSPGGTVRSGSSVNPVTGCAELNVDDLTAGNYFIFLEHAEPLERVSTYRMKVLMTVL